MWSILVQIIPKFMSYAAFIFGSAFLIFFGILLLTDNVRGWEGFLHIKIIIAIALIVLGIFLVANIYIYHRQLKMVGILLTYSCSFLSQKTINLVYIPIFLSLSVAMFVLSIF